MMAALADIPPAPRDGPDRLKRIVWHLGFMKTGTTAFQRVLYLNLRKIPEPIWVFPRRKSTFTLRQAANKFFLDPTDKTRETLALRARMIARRTLEQGREVALVSDENVTGFSPISPRGNCFDMAARVLPVLEAAVPADEVSFVMYTRDFPDWLRSVHNQLVKNDRLTQDFDDWAAGADFDRDWEAQRARIADTVNAPVIFRDFQEDLRAGDPTGAFILRQAGFSDARIAALDPPDRTNESLSPAALHFMLAANRSRMNDEALAGLRNFVTNTPEAFT